MVGRVRPARGMSASTSWTRERRRQKPCSQASELAKAPRGPGPLGLPNFDGLPEAEAQAWWLDLSRWVAGIRAAYPHLWPEPRSETDGVMRNRPRPFPRCWTQHPGVVSDLTVLRTWHDGLREGIDWAGGVQGYHEWRVFLDRVAEYLQIVARFCTPVHQDGMARPEGTNGVRSIGVGG